MNGRTGWSRLHFNQEARHFSVANCRTPSPQVAACVPSPLVGRLAESAKPSVLMQGNSEPQAKMIQ